ncbi:helix-turn-helix domain-containing protein [Streptomyces cellulosae]
MPNRRRPIDASTPLGDFALSLLDLQRKALARAGSSERARAISVDKIAAPDGLWKTSRASIYAALNGTRLPSPDTLCAMVSAWDEDSAEARRRWLRRRSDVEDALMGLQPSSGDVDAAEEPPPGPQDQLSEPEFMGSPKVVPDVTAHIELKQRLMDALARSGMVQRQVAARAGLSRTTVSQAINIGSSPPSARTLHAMSRAMRLDETERARLLTLRERAVTGRGPRNVGPL